MKLTLVIEANNLSDYIEQVTMAYAEAQGYAEKTEITGTPAPVVIPASVQADPAPAPAEKPRRGRKPSAQQGAEKTPAPDAAPAAAATTKELEDKLLKVMQLTSETKGMQTVRDVLARFGVQRRSDLKPEQFAEVIKKYEAVLAGEPV